MDQQTELLSQIRDLLLLMAEPAIAQRDEKLRVAVKQLVGRSSTKRAAVLKMNGNYTRSEIRQVAQIDAGDLSRLLKGLRESALLSSGDENPRLTISLPQNFFEEA